MSDASLRAKGVCSLRARPARAPGYKLVFALGGILKSEGSFAGIVPRSEGDSAPPVQGVLHDLDDTGMALMDDAEGEGENYRRITIDVETEDGIVSAHAYEILARREAGPGKPTQRYLNLLTQGARAHGVDPEYIAWLEAHDVFPVTDPGYPAAERIPDRWFDPEDVEADPHLTALLGVVIDLRDADPFLSRLCGGRELSVMSLKRLDTSDGRESLADVVQGRLSDAQRAHLHRMIDDLARVGRIVGRYRYPEQP